MNPEDKAYQEALDYLYSYVDYSLTRTFRYTPDKFDLGRVFTLLEYLGNPHRQYPVIHVAGTKGKGSTAAMIASALHAAGYRVGFYTSPHLKDFNERIQINGQSISHADLVRLVERLKPEVAKIPRLTTFELSTAVGFMYYADQKADVAVVEVGLGGRLDATNVVDPLVSVITSLSYDHIDVLGSTLKEIATEKGGIIKPGRPVVLAPQVVEARMTIEQIAAERNSPLYEVGRDYYFAPWTRSLDGQSLLVWAAEEKIPVDEFISSGGMQTWEPLRLKIPLLGYHQVENAATAYATLCITRQYGLAISDNQIQDGFSKVFWPGRFEVLRRTPAVIIDSAHNRDSALKLRLAIDDYLAGQPLILIFGASEDKDVQGMFAELLPRTRHLIVTQSRHPRAMDPHKLVELACTFGHQAQVCETIEDAMSKALELAGHDKAVVVAGSLFIAAAAREVWQAMQQPLEVLT